MKFSFHGEVRDDGTWTFQTSVPNGETVTAGDVVDRILVPALAELTTKRAFRIPTVAEELARTADVAPPESPE